MKNEVYLIDCMEFMEKVPDKYFETIINLKKCLVITEVNQK